MHKGVKEKKFVGGAGGAGEGRGGAERRLGARLLGVGATGRIEGRLGARGLGMGATGRALQISDGTRWIIHQ